ncbi:MAG: hypothetical protein AAGA99_17625 [Actinomycetota bacterium]
MTIVFELFAALLTLAGLFADEQPEPAPQIVVDAPAHESVVDTADPDPAPGSATHPPEETPAVDPPEAEATPLGQASGEVDQPECPHGTALRIAGLPGVTDTWGCYEPPAPGEGTQRLTDDQGRPLDPVATAPGSTGELIPHEGGCFMPDRNSRTDTPCDQLAGAWDGTTSSPAPDGYGVDGIEVSIADVDGELVEVQG